MVVLRQRLEDHVTADDLLAEPLESSCKLADAALERRRGVHVTEGDLQWHGHGHPCVKA